MIARPDAGGGVSRPTWKKYLLLMGIVFVAGLTPCCGLLPDPRLAVPPPPTREPIPATVQVAYAAEGYSLAAETARAWKQQACLADVLALYDWTGTEWKATEFSYYFLDQQSERVMDIYIKPETRIMEVYRPYSLSANTMIPDWCLTTPADQWQEKEALDSVTQMLSVELAAACGEVRAILNSFEPAPPFSWRIHITAGITKRYTVARLLLDVPSGEIYVHEKADPDTPCE
jgi:hypothetical protein